MYRIASTLSGLRLGKVPQSVWSVSALFRSYRENHQSRASRFRPKSFLHRTSNPFFKAAVGLNSSPLVCDGGSRGHCRKTSAAAEILIETSSDAVQAVEIECDGDVADSLMEALLSFGATSCSVEDANRGTEFEEEIYSSGPIPWQPDETRKDLWRKSAVQAYFPSSIQVGPALQSAASSLGWADPPPYTTSTVDSSQDWVKQIEDSYQPVQVMEGLWVVPSWCKPEDSIALNIVLEPGLAFGTGAHPTTRLCLSWLKSAVGEGDIVLDYGCGSGVLAVGAMLMGANSAVGVDTDPIAVTSSLYNASLNSFFPPDFTTHVVDSKGEMEGDVKSLQNYDLVVANILLNPLLDLAPIIAERAKPGGKVGLSGILVEQVRVEGKSASFERKQNYEIL